MKAPPKCWNIFGSKLLFMENDSTANVVHCEPAASDTKLVQYLLFKETNSLGDREQAKGEGADEPEVDLD